MKKFITTLQETRIKKMSAISYFQKYSQKENHITNNTMLMFRHIYRHSSSRFESLLKEIITDEQYDIGLIFNQQERASHSIPDGHIYQEPLSIYIEAKADGKLNLEQIKRHAESAAEQKKENTIIIGLAKTEPSTSDLKAFETACANHQVQFVSVTYSELIDYLNNTSLFPEYESDLRGIISDYEEFLRTEGMLPNPYEMVVFPCGTSWAENRDHKIYYEPARRSSKAHVPYIGIYTNKTITHIGEILATYRVEIENGKRSYEQETGNFPQKDAVERIEKVINETEYYNLGKDSERYYIIDELYEVNIEKRTSGGFPGHRYFDLTRRTSAGHKITSEDTISDIAKKLKGAHLIEPSGKK